MTKLKDIKLNNNEESNPLVQLDALDQYDKSALLGVKSYPSLELVRLEKMFFGEKKGKLFEYGFGSGPNTIHLLKCGYQVQGLDVSPNAVKRTKERISKIKDINQPELFLLEKNAKKIPFDDNTFDKIVAMSVISLLGSEKKVQYLFSEFKRILKPKGKIIMDINDHQSEFSQNKKQIEKNVFLSKPVDKEIRCYCLESEKDFINLAEPYFAITDSGFSSHKVFGRQITEFIICAENNK